MLNLDRSLRGLATSFPGCSKIVMTYLVQGQGTLSSGASQVVRQYTDHSLLHHNKERWRMWLVAYIPSAVSRMYIII